MTHVGGYPWVPEALNSPGVRVMGTCEHLIYVLGIGLILKQGLMKSRLVSGLPGS